MPFIDQELIRKRCEHNEGEIGSLEELSLHQEDLEKLEHLQHWCKDLKILLLHSNLITKIENLGKLKKLEYINFSVNNIERIENLEGCESLKKLDFTLNFIGELTSVQSLKHNIHLESLFLMGNPCADYEGYRDYVSAVVPQLKSLDSKEILISERIQATRRLSSLTRSIVTQQTHYAGEREKQKMRNKENILDIDSMTEQEIQKYWETTTDHSPESRRELALVTRKSKAGGQEKDLLKTDKRSVKLFSSEGRPLNTNQAKIPFTFTEDETFSTYILNVSVYRHLDTRLVDVDVEPKYVRVTVKNKVLQLLLLEEVAVDRCRAERSQTTGHLLVTMPKVKEVISPNKPIKMIMPPKKEKRDFLEVENQEELDFSKIWENRNKKKVEQVDESEVPPLE